MFLIIWENSRHEELQRQICKSFRIFVDTAQINFLQKLVTVPYYDAQLLQSKKFYLYSVRNCWSQNEIYEIGGIVHTNDKNIEMIKDNNLFSNFLHQTLVIISLLIF